MRRALGLALSTICVLAGWANAGETGRMVERAYQPAYVGAGSIYSSNGVHFKARAAERFVSVTIEDESGLPVPARVAQDLDGDRRDDVNERFCGSTTEPVAIEPGVRVSVWMAHGSCGEVTDPSNLGGWTTGTITATFSRG